MAKENHTYQIISAILLIAVISFAGLYFTKSVPNCPEVEEKECPQPEEKALIASELISWNENLYDNTEMFYTFNLYNYGDKEAKNVKVTCKSFESDTEKMVAKATDSFGNLASNSYNQYELITANVPTNANKEYISLCYVESCDNCEILHKNIPELVEAYATN